MIVEKAGLHVNAENQVIGWVEAGAEVDMQNGDTIISHHKTAEKKGVLEAFTQLKPVKEKAPRAPKEKSENGEKVARVRMEIPDDATYTVLKPDFRAVTDEMHGGKRAEIYAFIRDNTRVADVIAKYPDGYTFVGTRTGTDKSCGIKECLRYAVKRGMIQLNA